MKRMIRVLSLALTLVMVLSVSPLAANIYDVNNIRTNFSDCLLTAVQMTNGTASSLSGETKTVDGNTQMVFAGADAITVSFTPSAQNEDYVIFLLRKGTVSEVGKAKEENKANYVPNATNIYYIDQKIMDSKVNFTIYPSEMEAGVYGVYVASKNTEYQEVGNISVANTYSDAAFILGNVYNADTKVNTTDVLTLLDYLAGNITSIEQFQKDAADVNFDGKVNTTDALLILNFLAGNITCF